MSLLAAAVLSCVPALPFYCANIHVGCAGRTRVRTEPFTVSGQTVAFENGDVWETHSTKDRQAILLRKIGQNDWIRIEANVRFSLRRYAPRAMMTRGMCNLLPAS